MDERIASARGSLEGLHPYLLLDVFTAQPMGGNPLAVFTDANGLPASVMQAAARELNLSESVFLLAPPDGADVYARIFTPATELSFAGHPLLGTAVVVAGALDVDRAVVATAGGRFEVQVDEPRRQSPRATLAHGPAEPHAFPRVPELLATLGVERTALPVEAVLNGPVHVLVALQDAAAVAALRPDYGALAALGPLAVSCFAPDGELWRTRMFAPALGVAEDPATGSAAGPLAAHLCRHGSAPYDTWLEIRQGDGLGRPSTLWARVEVGSRGIERLLVRGHAVHVGYGALALDGAVA